MKLFLVTCFLAALSILSAFAKNQDNSIEVLKMYEGRFIKTDANCSELPDQILVSLERGKLVVRLNEKRRLDRQTGLRI